MVNIRSDNTWLRTSPVRTATFQVRDVCLPDCEYGRRETLKVFAGCFLALFAQISPGPCWNRQAGPARVPLPSIICPKMRQ